MSEIVAETKKPKELTKCKVCYKDIPENTDKQYNASMYYRKPFTCSTKCYNLDWVRSQPVGAGWMPLIWSVYNKLNKATAKTGEDWRVSQIKEKFGGLRFYVSGIPLFEVDDEGNDLLDEDSKPVYTEGTKVIAEAEAESYKTCEVCGESGVPRSGGWIRTLCDDDADGREPADWDNE